MADSYPEKITIEVERDKRCSYLRALGMLSWVFGVMPVSSVFAFAFITDYLKEGGFEGFADITSMILFVVSTSLGIGLLVSICGYFLFNYFSAKTTSESLELQIEGPFLRIKEGSIFRTDRKLHFRAILDYSFYDGPLMRRYGVGGISMTTAGGGQHNTIYVVGIKDAEAVRDLLAEVDRLREDLIAS